jgi:hypothetical protein
MNRNRALPSVRCIEGDVGTLFRDGGFEYPVSLAPYRRRRLLVRLHRDAA